MTPFQILQRQSRRVADGLQAHSHSKAYTADIDMTNALAQSECLLLNKLPPEVTLRIFQYVLTTNDDPTQPYLPDRIYYRPGYNYHQKTDISLLLTCKRIFDIARLMPVAEREHVFWLFGGPYQMMKTKVNGMARFDAWTASLNEEQQQAVKHVHIFAQQCYLEGLGHLNRLSPLLISTKHLTVTFRHSDWWSWESPAESWYKLGICPWLPSRVTHQTMLAQPLEPDFGVVRELLKQRTWGHQMGQVRGLQVLRIEFEVDVKKKAQLQAVLERAKYWKFPLKDTNTILEHIGQVRESSWEGLEILKDDSSPMLNPTASSDQSWQGRPKRTYYVAEMTWKRTTDESIREMMQDLSL